MALKINVQVSPQEQEMYELKERLKQLETNLVSVNKELADVKKSLEARRAV